MREVRQKKIQLSHKRHICQYRLSHKKPERGSEISYSKNKLTTKMHVVRSVCLALACQLIHGRRS